MVGHCTQVSSEVVGHSTQVSTEVGHCPEGSNVLGHCTHGLQGKVTLEELIQGSFGQEDQYLL